ncbi:endo alpha-1,4 polygalactosaminidase [Micromonospora olivasterospora]|uniref:Glycosyl hydrolase family 114 n=1 Tax=Micromonospora olivasterospora TaxID=1880 RepID=A0A562ID47_MICOL|nr:endo alpha-1,4 polygalactosaminidase [Micromonospora olivasterospora]TWH68822.1 glycosyl hydrolase family 114 [Micromonospora olivasterospora]
MRIRLPSPSGGHGPRRTLRSLVALALLASAGGCRVEWTPPGAPTPWPTESARHWRWQWQLSGPLDTGVDADVFLLDGLRTTAAETSALRARDRRLVCQVSVGAYARTDPDADRYPAAVRGAAAGRPGVRWVDVRRWEVLRPILADRFRLCRGKGFGAVALADADGYARRPGFPLDFDDQVLFNRRAAQLARSLDLSPGLLNDLPQVASLAPDFDFAVNEECVRLRECDRLLPFADAGKPVFHVEYAGDPADFCVTTVGYGFVSMRKTRDLTAWRAPCPSAP